MSLAVYGGRFNPPHLGHRAAAEAAIRALRPDRFLIVPDGRSPHKSDAPGDPDAAERFELCRLAFEDLPGAELSELALRRDGPCYMVDTLRRLCREAPGETSILVIGADMLPELGNWHEAEELLRLCSVAVLSREGGKSWPLQVAAEKLHTRFGTQIRFLPNEPLPMSSGEIRSLLPKRKGRELLAPAVYRRIIEKRYYGAEVDLAWLREQVDAMLSPKRIPHVRGCEKQAVHLAKRWGADPEAAAEAAIMHDMTKRWSVEEQLRYLEARQIPADSDVEEHPQLLHAITGAAAARAMFGASDEICSAIRWHTTGRPAMSLAEKILYLADMTEENRSFPKVRKLRRLCEEDLDLAMAAATRWSIKSIRERGLDVHQDTVTAWRYYDCDAENKEEI